MSREFKRLCAKSFGDLEKDHKRLWQEKHVKTSDANCKTMI